MRKLEDLTGRTYGRWYVVCDSGNRRNNKRLWHCKCSCGNTSDVTTGDLNSGKSTSCGCYKIERQTTHGMSNTKLYKVWRAMHDRCYNKNTEAYKNYGNRGITVCDRWHKFENFLEDMGEPKNFESIDRINNNGNYEPENCRWATMEDQANNKRNTRFILLNNERKSITAYSGISGINKNTIYARLSNGWDNNKIINTKTKRNNTN